MIDFNDIQISYGDFVAVDDLNFKVKEGEFFTFLGPSGCGKSTTLRCLSGFINPSRGSIHVGGKDITKLPVEKRKIGMVFQNYALFPTMTVKENIAFGLKVDKVSDSEINDRVTELAQLVDLKEEQIVKNVSELSGGQQQRVAIARALAKAPEIVLFDEPLSNLDARLRKQLRIEIKRIQQETNMTSIYVTHDQEEALTLSDRIAVFNNGKIEQIGTPHEIYNEPATEFVMNFIGDANKLTSSFIAKWKEESPGIPLDSSKSGYIRPEKISIIKQNDQCFPVDAEIIGSEFYGTYDLIELEIFGEKLNVIQVGSKEDVQLHRKLEVFIDPSDIIQF